MKPTVYPPHADMPSTTAMDTTKALDIRPILLNVMRFLNPRRRPHCDTPSAASNSVEIRILSLIVEAAATLRHFREKLSVAGCRMPVELLTCVQANVLRSTGVAAAFSPLLLPTDNLQPTTCNCPTTPGMR